MQTRVPIIAWNTSTIRSVLYQVVVLAAIAGAAYYLFSTTQANLERRSITTGFDFLDREAGFDIGETPIPYSAADRYSLAFVVGALNTLKVSAIGIVLAVILGVVIGVSRLSGNWLIAKLATVYVEGFRNIPLLLQLFFFYALFTESLPHPRTALAPADGVFLSNRGLYFGVPAAHPVHHWMAGVFVLAIVLWAIIRWWSRRRLDRTGRAFPAARVGICLCILMPLGVWIVGGAPTAMNVPELKGFNFRGGISISPEFAALLLGLVMYTAAFIAEVVRSGIESVSIGQSEAARALGLPAGRVMSLVVLPQALRVIIPPLTNQMLNLVKNSSLAVGIGYPDFVSVVNTSINQTGQAIEGVAMIMALYLFFSLTTSLAMNWYNARLKGR